MSDLPIKGKELHQTDYSGGSRVGRFGAEPHLTGDVFFDILESRGDSASYNHLNSTVNRRGSKCNQIVLIHTDANISNSVSFEDTQSD